eukprot:Skav221589  [mRNA]  locus=scaffold1698:169836:175186:+ [translate_table: standard]
MAFEVKCNCLRDGWFVFDSTWAQRGEAAMMARLTAVDEAKRWLKLQVIHGLAKRLVAYRASWVIKFIRIVDGFSRTSQQSSWELKHENKHRLQRMVATDCILVFLMVSETFVVTMILLIMKDGPTSFGFGNAGILRLFRLLRLTRMARMLRSMPELMILIKGMAAATTSVLFIFCLQLILLYVFAIDTWTSQRTMLS